MGNLYALATRVHVLLGPPFADTDITKSDPATIKNAISRLLPRIEDEMRRFSCTPIDVVNHNPGFDIDDEDIYLAFNIARRPWWTRIWVLQEACLAHRPLQLQFGPATFSLDDVFTVLEACDGFFYRRAPRHLSLIKGFAPPFTFQATIEQHQSLPSEVSPVDRLLLMLESTSGQYEAREPRDRVIALLGMLPDLPEKRRIVSYTTPLDEFFRDLAVYLVKSTGSLSILRFCPPKSNTLPSWVPDWAGSQIKRAAPTPSSIRKFKLSTCQKQLLVHAIPVGLVKLSYELGTMHDRTPKGMRSELLRIEGKIREVAELQGSPSGAVPAFRKMILQSGMNLTDADRGLDVALLSLFFADSDWPEQRAMLGDKGHVADRVEGFVRDFLAVKRILVVTSLRWVGSLTNPEVHVDGDHVYILPDSLQTFVLQKQHENQYRIVNRLNVAGSADTPDGSMQTFDFSVEEITIV
jgi:hypothetical protein